MDEPQLQTIIDKIEALKTENVPAEFAAGVDAARDVVAAVIQEQADRKRMQQLEEELAQLRMKYQPSEPAVPKKRGRKPKQTLSASAQ